MDEVCETCWCERGGRGSRAGGRRSASAACHRSRARGFTLIELSIVLIIIAVLAGIAIVGIRGTILTARNAGERQVCVSLKETVEQFKQQFGFLPPLIDDFDSGGPYEAGGVEDSQPRLQAGNPPVLVAGAPSPDAFLGAAAPDQDPSTEDSSSKITAKDMRLSTSSLPIYLVGAADAVVDGVDGPGFSYPRDGSGTDGDDGHFRRAGKAYPAMFDVTKDRSRLSKRLISYALPNAGDPPPKSNETRYAILDRWGHAFRYYRWKPVYYTKSNAPDPGMAGQVAFYNVPVDVELALGLKAKWKGGSAPKSTDTSLPDYYPAELRSASFAIISLGADGVLGPNSKDGSVDDIVELGQ